MIISFPSLATTIGYAYSDTLLLLNLFLNTPRFTVYGGFMRLIAVALGFIAVMLAGATVHAEKRLRFATEGGYPPFNYVQNGEAAGFDVDIGMALCRAMDAECGVLVVEWGALLDGLIDGKYDFVVASMARTDERDTLVDFTTPYYRSRTNFIGNPAKLANVSRKQLAGKTLAAQRDTVQAQYLEDNFGDAAHIKLFPTLKESYAALANGSVDALLVDSLVAFEFLQSEHGQDFDYIGDPVDTADPSSEARIVVRSGDRELLQDIETALNQIRLDGTYERINRAYFPFSIY